MMMFGDDGCQLNGCLFTFTKSLTESNMMNHVSMIYITSKS